MPKSRVRGGRKAHNKRIQKRRQIIEHIEHLKQKIYEEAKESFYKEKQGIKIKQDD